MVLSKIVAFTGAGISAPSGLPTYESQPWLRNFFTYEAYIGNPEAWFERYQWLKYQITLAKPNKAHYLLANNNIPVVTQNIDRLHTIAGSASVMELHGRYDIIYCSRCLKVLEGFDALCECGGFKRPDIVFYGEHPKKYWEAHELMASAEIVIVIGTSLQVSPARELVIGAERNGARIIVANKNAESEVQNILKELGY